MDMQQRVDELVTEFQEIKKTEAEFKMKVGKYDDKAKELLKELGVNEKSEVNIIEVLSAYSKTQSWRK